jgi:hypothetical protein
MTFGLDSVSLWNKSLLNPTQYLQATGPFLYGMHKTRGVANRKTSSGWADGSCSECSWPQTLFIWHWNANLSTALGVCYFIDVMSTYCSVVSNRHRVNRTYGYLSVFQEIASWYCRYLLELIFTFTSYMSWMKLSLTRLRKELYQLVVLLTLR